MSLKEKPSTGSLTKEVEFNLREMCDAAEPIVWFSHRIREMKSEGRDIQSFVDSQQKKMAELAYCIAEIAEEIPVEIKDQIRQVSWGLFIIFKEFKLTKSDDLALQYIQPIAPNIVREIKLFLAEATELSDLRPTSSEHRLK